MPVTAPILPYNPAHSVPPRPRRPLSAPAPEAHEFTTADGTRLRLTRYRGGDKGPVLLAHGLGVSSLIFTIDTIDTNLVEHLCEKGYDTWLLDFRSSVELGVSTTRYTGDTIATQDWPAAVKAVLEITGKESVQVIAHCWGATTFTMAMLAGALSGVRSAVISQVSAHVVTPVATRLKTGLHIPSVLDALGVSSLTAYVGKHPDWRDRLFDKALKLYPVEWEERCNSAVCHRITFLYGLLYEHDQLNAETHEHLHEMFGVASITAFEHLMRISNAGHVVGSGGEEMYIEHLHRMNIPIFFLHGAENACFKPESTRATFAALKAVNGASLYGRREILNYGHIDCIFGKNAARDVYPYMTAHLDAT